MKYKNIKTTKYRNKPVKKAGVKPKTIDKTTESTEPRTDIVPLAPREKVVIFTKTHATTSDEMKTDLDRFRK